MSDGMFALTAGAAGDFLRRNRRFLRFRRWFAGTSFIGLGVTAALGTLTRSAAHSACRSLRHSNSCT
ncbi:MAG: hypothetical protein ABSE69_04955 [Roseiarcus sp.]